MGIVIITIPGEDKRFFANKLHQLSKKNVDLVVIQKRDKSRGSIFKRLRNLYKKVGTKKFFEEIYYAFLLRMNRRARNTLRYFREDSNVDKGKSKFLPPILETDSVNSDEVHQRISELKPDVLVIWASVIVKPHIISTARHTINLHMGLCPHYRGAIANQNAILRQDRGKIGATIHHVEQRVDTGDIIETIVADISRPPRELFQHLNDHAEKRFIDIALRLYHGESLTRRSQMNYQGENLKLKDWTPKVRYGLAKQIINWEDSFTKI